MILAERAGRQSREGSPDAAAVTIATVEEVAREALAEIARASWPAPRRCPANSLSRAAVDRLAERFRAEAGLAIDVEFDIEDAAPLDREAQVGAAAVPAGGTRRTSASTPRPGA